MKKTFTDADRDLSLEEIKAGIELYKQMEEAKQMGIIADRVAKAFKLLEDGKFNEFVKELVDCADYSVHSSGHRKCMDEALDKELAERTVSYDVLTDKDFDKMQKDHEKKQME